MALESNNAEMTKRLKYTKDILTHMLNNNKPGGGGTATINLMSGSGSNVGINGVGGPVSSNRNGIITTAGSSKRSGGMTGLSSESVLP